MYAELAHAPVAHLDRVLGFEPRGSRFKSCRAHHSSLRTTKNAQRKGQAAVACPVSPPFLLLFGLWWRVGHAGIEIPHFSERSLEISKRIVRGVIPVIRPPNDVRVVRQGDVADCEEKMHLRGVIGIRFGRRSLFNVIDSQPTSVVLGIPGNDESRLSDVLEISFKNLRSTWLLEKQNHFATKRLLSDPHLVGRKFASPRVSPMQRSHHSFLSEVCREGN